MERPSKKPRLSSIDTFAPPIYDDFDLQAARARNDLRLKSVFESIFEKYGRDFSDVGDEIDLRTGEIVVNKGHLMGMQGEGDTEDLGDSPEDELQAITSGDALLGKDEGNNLTSTSDREEESREGSPSGEVPDFPHLHFPPTRQQSTTLSDKPVDPLWQVPEIDEAKFYTPQPRRQYAAASGPEIAQVRSASPLGKKVGSIWSVRRRGRPRKNDITPIPKKKLSVTGKMKPLKPPSMRDWDFARVQDDSSDSDDPLLEGTPQSSTVNSVSTIRGVERGSATPKTPGGKKRGLFETRKSDGKGLIETPSISSSSAPSSPVHEISPSVRRQRSQKPDVALEHVEDKPAAESQDEWEEETITDLRNWQHSQLDDQFNDKEFDYVQKSMDKPRISRQTIPSWIKEIKTPMAGSTAARVQESTDDSVSEDSVFDDTRSSQCEDSEKDPTPGTDDLSPKGFEEVLSQDFDDFGPGSGISSIQLDPAAGSQKTTPIKAKSPYRKNARSNYY
ncbi:hypothetical protein VTN49DRAFT_6046 [Thermomyces lanuginosus]|uniref:uncharacterized protein n=1 Tax=Thermomyces lanuginosus TaxID=5541 RepID=UPI003744385B